MKNRMAIQITATALEWMLAESFHDIPADFRITGAEFVNESATFSLFGESSDVPPVHEGGFVPYESRRTRFDVISSKPQESNEIWDR